VEPVLDAEVTGHFRNPGTHSFLVTAQAFQAEGQFVPYLVGYNLVIGILHNITDFGRLIPRTYLINGGAVEKDCAGSFAVRSQYRLQMPQQGGFAAAAFSAKNDIFTLLDGKAYILQRCFALGGGVREG